jgi:hypothetical protein
MAERMVRQLLDDLDGTEILDGDGERVVFAVRGTSYQIDLSSNNVAKLEQALKPFIDAAVKVRRESGRARKEIVGARIPRDEAVTEARRKGGRKRKAAARTPAPKEQVASIRDWARQNGYEVSERGRLRSEIIEAFEAAH